MTTPMMTKTALKLQKRIAELQGQLAYYTVEVPKIEAEIRGFVARISSGDALTLEVPGRGFGGPSLAARLEDALGRRSYFLGLIQANSVFLAKAEARRQGCTGGSQT